MSQFQITPESVERRLALVRKVGWVVMAALLVFGVVVGGKALVDARALLADHTEVTAEVVDKEIELRRGSKGRTVKDHMVTYSFVAPEGQQIVDRYQTSKAKFEQLSFGDTFPMLFSNSDSSRYDRKELVLTQASFTDLVRRLVGIMFFGCLMFALIYFLSKRKLKERLAVQSQQFDPVAEKVAA